METPRAEHGGRHALADTNPATAVRYDFSVCVNAFGPAPGVRRAIETCRVDEYPDPLSRLARHAASERWGRPVTEIVLGAGSAEILQAACLAYLQPKDRVLVAGPAFGEYARAATLCGAIPSSSSLLDSESPAREFAAEIGRLRPRLAFLASPANPPGHAMAREDLQHVADACAAAQCLLVLDQAYDAFTASPLGTPALPGHPAVLHVRSITKDHALAGVRVAFAVAPPAVVRAIEAVRVPWAASAIAQVAAVAAMDDHARAHVERTTTALRDEAERIAVACAAYGIEVRPSATHYRLVKCTSARATRDRLLTQSGILVRDCTSFGLPEWVRVAARAPTDNDVLIAALRSDLV